MAKFGLRKVIWRKHCAIKGREIDGIQSTCNISIHTYMKSCLNSFRPKKNALFILDLQLDKNSAIYSTDLDNFERVAISLFDKGIACTKNVPQLEKMVLEGLFWSGTPLLESVGVNEPEVVKKREMIRKAIRQSLIPLKAYAKQYEKFLDLHNLDINQYLE